MSARAVLWDLDGTLVDSADQHWRAWHETMLIAGVQVTRKQFQTSFGQRNDVILSTWLDEPPTSERVRRLGEAKEVCYRRMVRDEGVVPLPGAERWIVQLADDGWMQAIASSAPRQNVDVVIGALGLGHYFAAIVAAEDVRRGKPEPDVFVTAAQRLAVTPDRCVVVEDTVAGVEAARRAGMVSVMVSASGNSSADVVVKSLDALDRHVFDRLTGGVQF
jgi:HAD superfamily hydrolase (TIGR01509 family)